MAMATTALELAAPPSTRPSKTGRIEFVDVVRAYAIVLVTFGHALGDLRVWRALPLPVADVLTFVTRGGTPMFVLLFGMMVELVHVRRAERDGVAAIAPRLRRRALDCYGCYLFVSACAAYGGSSDWMSFGKSAVFAAGAGFGTVLGTYAVLLLAVPTMLRLRLRFGLWMAPMTVATVWALDQLVLSRFDGVDTGPWAYSLDFVFGAGRHVRGPSVLHALSFVGAGMFLAAGLRRWHSSGARDFRRHAASVAAVAGIVVVFLASRDGFGAVVEGFREYHLFRRHNAPGYFAVGTLTAVGALAVAAVAVPRRGLPAWADVPLQLGRSSLLAFTLGSAGLHLYTVDLSASPVLGVAAALAYVGVVTALVNWRRAVNRVIPGVAANA